MKRPRIVLRSAYYVLDEDVALNFADGFTGIGDTDYFGGHFDGGNHTVKLNLTGTVTGAARNLYFGLFGPDGTADRRQGGGLQPECGERF